LWTPGYWGWGGAAFIWHVGYWGPHVGFYGGINYGFGYPGVGFVGGEWRGGAFFYNRAVVNLGGAHITNVYYTRVVNNFAVNRVSYNGGAGGLAARPSAGELAAEHDRHEEATSIQQRHETAAHNERSQFASVNHGMPGVAATGRAGEFKGGNVVQASRAGGSFNPKGPHPQNAGHTPGYSNFHSANPGGGEHQSPTWNRPSTPVNNPPERGQPSAGFHSTTPSHGGPAANEPYRGNSPHGEPSVQHSSQPSVQHGSQPPAKGEHEEKHESEPKR
jgi:hypothetical protein